jgi:hypothetical protein
MNYIDRYTYKVLQEEGGLFVTKQQFQLLSVTCLYLAIKMACPALLTLKSMLYLSRDIFTAEQITSTELDILVKLNYHLHPPTSYVFLCHDMLFLKRSGSDLFGPSNKVHYLRVLEAARFSLELSVLDFHFVKHRPSHVAMAALMNAVEDEPIPFSSQLASDLLDSSELCSEQDMEPIRHCQRRLRGIHSNMANDEDDASDGGAGADTMMEQVQCDQDARVLSPVCVTTQRVG